MLTLLSGTNRPGNTTRKVVAHVEAIYRSLGVTPVIVDLLELPLEAFTPGSYANKPASLQPFLDRILAATGLVVVTPEYNGGFPGALKYFIDLLPFPQSLQARPVCFIGVAAGEWGAIRPIEQLQGLFLYRNAWLYPEKVYIRQCMKVIDSDGNLLDEEISKRLRSQAEGFLRFLAQHGCKA